jgi:tetratricopeptide (TPR) repeat protein
LVRTAFLRTIEPSITTTLMDRHNMAGHKRTKFTKRKVLIILGAVGIVIATIGAGAGIWWLQHKDDKPSSPVSVNAPPTATSEAQKLAFTGDVEGSNKKLQEALNKTDVTSDEKVEIYIQQAVNLSNQKQYQKAWDILKQAEALKQTFTISHLIGEQAEALGDKQTAIQYYKKTLTQLDTKAIGYQSNKRTYEAKVKELGGTL